MDSRYEDALERCKKEFDFNNLAYSHEEIRQRLERVFPELRESEDEKIRKALIQNLKERFGTKGNMGEGLNMPDVLAWLEKQGDEKPTEDALKKLPKWRKAEKDGHKKLFDESGALEIMNGKICIVQCVTIGDFYIPVSEILALPKEECNS